MYHLIPEETDELIFSYWVIPVICYTLIHWPNLYYKGIIFLGYCHQIVINLTVGHTDKDISLKNYGKEKTV